MRTHNSPPPYPLSEPLGGTPSQIIGNELPDFFGPHETMASILVALCREAGDQWQGFPVSLIGRRTIEAYRARKVPGGDPISVCHVGLWALYRANMLQVEHLEGDVGNNVAVIYPTAKLLEFVRKSLA